MMIKNDGVTLIELLIVISIIGLLAVALGFSFEGWMGNYRIESQTKEIYADLMDARTRAMTRNRAHFVVFNAANYQIYEDTNDNNAPDPGTGDNPIPEFTNPKQVQYNFGWTGRILFDVRGLSSSAATITIPLTLPSGANPDYDCIKITQARIQMGKYDGTNCVEK